MQLTPAFLLLALGAAADAAFVVHESIKTAPSGFTAQSTAALASRSITLRIQLAQNNIAGLETELYAVSTPGSAKYGQHLSAAEVASYVTPSDETASLVNAWLKENDVTPKTISNAGDWLQITLPISKANDLLNTEFTTYTDSNGKSAVRALSYSVPEDLVGHIDVIHPTVKYVHLALHIHSRSPLLTRDRSLAQLPREPGPPTQQAPRVLVLIQARRLILRR